jgi:PUB domain
MSNAIELVVQLSEDGSRRNAPGNWNPMSTLSEIIGSLQSDLELRNATLRYMQTCIPESRWSITQLKDIGITEPGRSLLVLELGDANQSLGDRDKDSRLLEMEIALKTIFDNHFDADSKDCIITMIKILDNVLQNPLEPKVRSLRMENKAFSAKVVSRKGGGMLCFESVGA